MPSNTDLRISDAFITSIYQKALAKPGLLNADDTAAVFFDLDIIDARIEELNLLFPPQTIHAMAVKANPLGKILEAVVKKGAGLEVATLPELYLAQKAGCPPCKIIFDSPCKTLEELQFALQLGCHINADSFAELERINTLVNQLGGTQCSIGLRVNPQVGTGTIASTSVAGDYSKFGVPMNAYSDQIIAAYVQYSWLNSIHIHVGSQGCNLNMLLNGIKNVVTLINQINAVLSNTNSVRRIDVLDMGGGLPVTYKDDQPAPDIKEYTDRALALFKPLLDNGLRLVTEFGRHINANAAWAISDVEYVKNDPDINTAMIHLGADMFLRKCYRPDDWHHDIAVLEPDGTLKQRVASNPYNVAGPLCFAGDIIAQNIALPEINAGDKLVIKDVGAYTLSMWSRYNSRQMPKIISYRNDGEEFAILKDRESLEDLFKFWT